MEVDFGLVKKTIIIEHFHHPFTDFFSQGYLKCLIENSLHYFNVLVQNDIHYAFLTASFMVRSSVRKHLPDES